ncbi:MAG: HD domain-containing protein [Desulfobulbaceae bacterium]|nr:HD domain-containing protein [Desulfobulbaceae bacterium]
MQTDSKPIPQISIDELIGLVEGGHTVKTGIDIYTKSNLLLLEKDFLVDRPHILLNLKKKGIEQVPIHYGNDGGIWNKKGEEIRLSTPKTSQENLSAPSDDNNPQIMHKTKSARKKYSEIELRIMEINTLKTQAEKKYQDAKINIKNVIKTLQDSGGEIDYVTVQETVEDLFLFVSEQSSAFSYLTKEIFSYDDYLYNHSINVCAIGTAVAKKFNNHFSSTINASLNSTPMSDLNDANVDTRQQYTCYYDDELYNISIGLFMHDLGKVLVNKDIINKNGKLSKEEFTEVQKHSAEKGGALLDKNNISNPFIKNITKYHHSKLYDAETRCYPNDREPLQIPPYVKICKLADIYDAMTSKRCYKEAHNPVGVVSDIFHKYAKHDRILQYVLHAFVNSIGIYPPGSIVALVTGQIVYVLDSSGPTVLPITDSSGSPLLYKPDPLILDPKSDNRDFQIDRRRPPMSPREAYKITPAYLRDTITPN